MVSPQRAKPSSPSSMASWAPVAAPGGILMRRQTRSMVSLPKDRQARPRVGPELDLYLAPDPSVADHNASAGPVGSAFGG